MDLKKAEAYIGAQLESLEKAAYYFETVAKPRYEQDMVILKKLREDLFKLTVLKQRKDAGEEISDADFHSLVPAQFR